jgi:outer membrane protein
MVKHMYVRSLLLFLVLVLLLQSTSLARSVPADSLTVTGAVHMALSANPALQQAADQVRAATAGIGISKSALYPEADVSLNYSLIGPVPQLFFPGLGSFKLYPENNYDAHVGVRQKVYDFGKNSTTIDVSESKVKTAEEGVEMTKSGIAYQTIQTFYAILYLQQSIDVENQDIQTLTEHMAVNKKRVAAGTGTDFEVLTTQVRVAAAQNQKIDLENYLQKQEIALRRFIGLPDSTPLKLNGEFLTSSLSLDSDSLTDLALRQRPDYLASRQAEKTAGLQYRLSQVSDMPTLNVNAAFGVKNGFIPNLDILRGNWVAGVQVQVPLYKGGKTEYQEEEAQAALDGSRDHTSDLERQIHSEVRQAISDLSAARDKLEATALQVKQAEDALSIAQKRYDAGTVSNLDVLDAETSLSQAHLLRLRALYAFVTSRYALDHAIGTKVWQ